jgi:hypothetical protein
VKYLPLAALLLASALVAPVAFAQEPGDEEAAFDDALKNYGYAAGAAVQCADEAEKSALVEEAAGVFDRIVQLFGTDQAFYFSAAFGAGTVDAIEEGTCETYTAAFAEGLTSAETEDGE